MLCWYQETETLQLQPTQLCFLLDDLVRKLDHSLLATAGKRRCFLKVPKNHAFNECNFAEEIIQFVIAIAHFSSVKFCFFSDLTC